MNDTCTFCPYPNKARIPAPKPKGQVDLLILGEAPGINELAKKRPFVGKSGQLLKKCLTDVGFNSNDYKIFVTNALLCLPPKIINKDSILACQERILSNVETCKPRLILALGKTAVMSLTSNFQTKITSLHGRLLDTPHGPVLACLHPAAILRNPDSYSSFKRVIHQAKHILDGKTNSDVLETKRIVFDPERLGISETVEILQLLRSKEVLALDIETEGLKYLTDPTIVLGIAFEPGKVIIFKREHFNVLEPLFKLKHKPKFIWHNGKFDSKFLQLQHELPRKVDEDTMLMHYALDETKGTHDLEQLAINLLGVEPYEHLVKPYLSKEFGYRDCPRPLLYDYLAKDCDYTLRLYHKLNTELLQRPKQERLYKTILLPASDFLDGVEQAGLYVNQDYLDEVSEQLQTKQDALNGHIYAITSKLWDREQYLSNTGAKTAPVEMNVGSTKQVAWLLYQKLKLFSPFNNVDEEALDYLKNSHPLIPYLLELRKLNKLKSTYVDGLHKYLDEDSRVRSSYWIHGTETGRLSSSQPNLQNIPRSSIIRDLFQAPPGRRLIEADYAGAELRVLAVLSGDKFMTKVFHDGRDLHSELAASLFGEDFDKEQRSHAKNINFGIAYGLTARALASDINVSIEQAQSMIDGWYKRFPEAELWLQIQREKVKKAKSLTTPFGRKRHFHLVTQMTLNEQQNQASNFPIQSVASDLTLISGIQLAPKLKKLNCDIVNIVHDSILVECPDNNNIANTVRNMMQSIMTYVPKAFLETDVPFGVDFKQGYKWGSLENIGNV